MNLVDSCGWLEYFVGGPNAGFFAPAIQDTPNLLVPTICLLEVYKRFLILGDAQKGAVALAAMMEGRVVDLDARTATLAATIGRELGIPLADSVILATARIHGGTVWTQDAHFQGIPDARLPGG